ncbi:hypothetical protein PISMIDRAFT_688104, partial [Pisolithus microcarpus 441]
IGEVLVRHDLGICCITPASHRDGAHVDETACELDVFYRCMQPWFCGQDSERKRRSEGIGNREDR